MLGILNNQQCALRRASELGVYDFISGSLCIGSVLFWRGTQDEEWCQIEWKLSGLLMVLIVNSDHGCFAVGTLVKVLCRKLASKSKPNLVHVWFPCFSCAPGVAMAV